MRIPPEAAIISAVAAIAGIGAGVFLYRRMRVPKDPEAERRRILEQHGRIVEGTVLDVHDGFIYYSWSWRGVIYESSQDVSVLEHLLPSEPNLLIGRVGVRFLPRNPTNSIVLSENWNGFRVYNPKVQVPGL